jgi:hypothetical protein
MRDVKPIFDWANRIGDANINNRILGKVLPVLIEAKIVLTDSMIQEQSTIIVPQHVYDAIREDTQNLLATQYQEEK